MIRAAPLVLALALSASCRPSETPAPARGAPRLPATAPAPGPSVKLRPGLRLTLAPNQPDVSAEDVPEATRRTVEVVSFDGKRMRLRWKARVLIERSESARRRQDWVRARFNGVAVPPTPPAAVYDDKELGGTLDLPDFTTATGLLLPGLWPEGSVTLKGSTAFFIPVSSFRELLESGKSLVPFFPPSPFVTGPAADLLHRAAGLYRTPDGSGSSAEWKLVSATSTSTVVLDGRAALLPTIRAESWFGLFEVLADESNPIVIAVLPQSGVGGPMEIFAPANVLRTLLAYRVVAIETARSARDDA